MKRAAAVQLLLLVSTLAGCRALDVTQPIALVPEVSWNTLEAGILADAAECWNLQFGTQFRVDRDATIEQQVRVGYSDAACLDAGGLTIAAPPVRVAVCPLSYMVSIHAKRSQVLMDVLIHELGHVANILGHASGHSVMNSESILRPEQFSNEDIALFNDANADALPAPGCTVRIPAEPYDDTVAYHPGREGCACETP